VRRGRLQNEGLSESDLVKVLGRDESEGLPYGQNVRAAIEMADFFVRNDGSNGIKVDRAIARFLEVIFATNLHTPSRDELAMHAAKSAASASACLSRQVGAVVVSKDGEIIGTGANDVPKFGGGLYSEQDGDDDHRCWKWKAGICHNDSRKTQLLDSIVSALRIEGVLKASSSADPRELVRAAGIKDLIEFSRSVHAEMEAIISVARSGRGGLIGATLYSTTFPCHSCARHIVASGIHRVVYVEPYPKSLAIDLHDDAVSTDEKDMGKKVVFLQYEGVAPRSFLRLFSDRGNRKDDGHYVYKPKLSASPVSPVPLDGFVDREKMVVLELSKRESAPTSGG
jgi:deoxycytidylate deaminase